MPKIAQPDSNGIVSKLSNATLGCDPLVVKDKAKGTKAPMYRVLGRATGIKEAKDTNGEVIYGLSGSFEGTNLLTGQVMRSGVCYLPPGIHETILEPLDKALAEDTANQGVMIQFAFDIFAVAAPNKSGYSYEAQDLVAPEKRVDMFADMRDDIAGHDLPALTDDQKKLLKAPAGQ